MKSNRQTKREAAQLLRLCMVNGWPDETRIRQVLEQVGRAGLRRARAILKHFARLMKLQEAQRTVTVESARALTPDLRDALEKGLTRRYGQRLTLVFRHRPALIGGVRIQIGSDVYDGSVSGRLAALEKNF